MRYRRWVLDEVRPWLGPRLLEVGCGIGLLTEHLLDRDRVVAIDVEAAYLRDLEARLGPHPNLRTLRCPLEHHGLADGLSDESLDSALLLNVLEHIRDDARALRNLVKVLNPGATVVVQVPAHRFLYGETDRALGHVRRYDATELARTFEAAGLHLDRLWQRNLLGVAGWFVSSRLRREPMFSARALSVYETLLPLQRLLEPTGGVRLGLSIMAVARTP